MRRSDIMRGLAASAVSALALAAIPSVSHATPINDQVGDDNVVLYSQSTGFATEKNDGANTTIRLEAGAGANISSVKFQYQIGAGAAVDIATVSRNDNGAFSHEWTLPAGLAGNAVNIIASAVPDNTAVVSDTDTANVMLGGAVDSVDLANGDTIGVYQSPHTGTPQNIIVSGTTSDAGDSVVVSHLEGLAATAALVSGTDKKFTGVLDISGDYTYGATDEIVLGAVSGSDDVEAYSLYKQVVTTVTATPAATQVPSGGTTTVKVVVTDQNGKPIAGAEVASGSTVIGTTGADGSVTTTQGAGTKSYHANATAGSAEFNEVLGDKKSADVTVTPYLAGPVSLKAESQDKAAFDLDEYAAGDITVDVLDSQNASVEATGQKLTYHWVVTPFAGGPAVRVPATGESETLDGAGTKYQVALPAGGVEGTYELFAALAPNNLGNNGIAESKVLTVKAGEATVDFDAASPEAGAIGSTVDVKGKLVLDDGTGLPGRAFDATYTTAPGGNAVIVPVTDRKTDANGAFTVQVKDAATPVQTELGGSLDVTATGNTDATADQGVDFVTDQVPDGAVLTVDQDGAGKPGLAENGTVTLTTSTGTPLAGVLVTLSVDHGFFTDGSADPAPAKDALVGELKSLGDEITVATNGAGVASFKTAIERDEDFDDDGKVTAEASATVDGVSGDDSVVWDSSSPLNFSEVSVELTPEADQEGPVDPARTGTFVWYDLFAKDQFGNLVKGAVVNVDCTEDGGDDHPCPAFGGVDTTDFDNGGDVYVDASEAGVYEMAGELDYTANVYNATPAPTTTPMTVTDEFTTEFYDIDWTASTAEIERTPAGETVGLNATVTETVTVVDQEGNPVEGLWVDFVRTGDTNESRFQTNGAGQATYVFRVTQEGTETVTAVVRLLDGTVVKQLSDSMLVDDGVGPVDPKVFIEGANAKGKDKLTVFTAKRDADLVAGLDVDLYKKVDGEWKQVGNRDAVMGQNGVEVFVVKDRNGRKVTAYRAIVDGDIVTKTIRQR